MSTKHNVFISYHHANDQWAKKELLALNTEHEIFIDGSVDTGDIDENLPDEKIRTEIRDEYLRNTTVTILLVGTETKNRKHIDWEIFSSMIDGAQNKKSGILVIQLPSVNPKHFTAAHGEQEKDEIYPSSTWTSVTTRTDYEERYPYLSARIIDNLLKPEAKISIARWNDLDADKIRLLIDLTFNDKGSCDYDLSRKMRRRES
jgi:hypothetical protein